MRTNNDGRQEQIGRLNGKKLREIWQKVRNDEDASKALKYLEKKGFAISHLAAGDPGRHTWADDIAAIPLLRNRPAARRIHRKRAFRKYLGLVGELRQFAKEVEFCEVNIVSEKDYPVGRVHSLSADLLQAALMIENVLSWDWYVRSPNPQNAVIAGLRWQIRWRTGAPRDRQLNVLIDAAFRAAGYPGGRYIDATALDRIEKREKEGRVKATRRLRSSGSTQFQFIP